MGFHRGRAQGQDLRDVDAKDLFQRALNSQPISLADDSLVRKVLIVPDRPTLFETLDVDCYRIDQVTVSRLSEIILDTAAAAV
ncbi:MAG: hypothetical protein ABIQ90_07585 [Polaromonas sp.]